MAAACALLANPALAQQQQQPQQQQIHYSDAINVRGQLPQQQQQQQLQFEQWQAQQQQTQQQPIGQQQNSVSTGGPTSITMKTVAVTINGKTFQVSKAASDRIHAWLKEQLPSAKAGMWVAAVAAMMDLWGFVTLDGGDFSTAWGVAEGINDIIDTDVDGLVDSLTLPAAFNTAVRAQMVGMIEQEIWDAAKRNASQEVRMWQHLQDVLRNPERYQGGGIKIDSAPGQPRVMRARDPAGERYRSIPAWEGLGQADRNQLALLTNNLRFFAPSRDHIISASYLADIGQVAASNAGSARFSIDHRDRALLNEAMYRLPSQVKVWIEPQIIANANNLAMNRAMWIELHGFLRYRNWQDNVPYAPYADEQNLGLADDDSSPSSLITGCYPFYVGYGQVIPAFGPSGPTFQPLGTALVNYCGG